MQNKKDNIVKFTINKGNNDLNYYKVEVTLKTRSMDFYLGDVLKLQNPQDNNRICGAIVENIHRGNEKISVDGCLRDNLNVSLGDIINVEVEPRKNARVVELLIPIEHINSENNLMDDIKVRLMRKPVHSGNKIPVPITCLNEIINILILKTEPVGVVIVSDSTELKCPLMNIENLESIEEILEYLKNY
ncbi:MAG: hypothetical protein L6282_18395 [Candidatus Methanoperedenaceae archaeon]|nr:hypothetical protein [Candidatus Methanoperedenaceae archaeon]